MRRGSIAWLTWLAAGSLVLAEEQRVEDIVAWINDDIITWTELQEAEQGAIGELMEGKSSADEMAKAMQTARSKVLIGMITDFLLVQQAEALFDMKAVEEDLLDNFKERNKLKSEEEVEGFLRPYKMSKQDLMRRLRMMSVPGYVIDNQVRRNLSVSEAEARAWYAAHPDRFTTPMSVALRELFLSAAGEQNLAARKSEAEALLAQAKTSTDLEALIRAESEAPSRETGGKVGPLDPKDLRKELASALQTINPGEWVLVASSSGWHILKLEQRTDATVATFDQVRETVENQVRIEKSQPAYDAYIGKLWREAQIEVRKEFLDRLPADQKSLVKAI